MVRGYQDTTADNIQEIALLLTLQVDPVEIR